MVALKEEKRNHMTYPEMVKMFREFNTTHNPNSESIVGIIVFKADNWDQEYSLESRSYRVGSDNKAFIDGMGGYSIFGSSLDGSDRCVRLEDYIDDEGGAWEVDYCYLESEVGVA